MRLIAFICACVCVLGLAGSTGRRPGSRFWPPATTASAARPSCGSAGRCSATRRGARRTCSSLLGDNDYTESPARFRANWRAAFGWARRSGLRVAGVLGNHDYHVNRGRYELALLGMPRPYYTRRLGDIQLFLLDSNEVNSGRPPGSRASSRTSTAIWKIAVFHHPPYTCGGHSGDQNVQERWVPALRAYGVQLVLSGHDHNYQRFVARNGVTYVVHGGGARGSIRYGAALRLSGAGARLVQHGFLYVTATAERLDGYAVNMRGRVTDRFSLEP